MSIIILTVSSIYIKVAIINREQAELQSLRTSSRLHTKEINTLVLQGFQIEQEIPEDVWEAFEYLVEQGYTNRLIKV